jgi:hypothetical protein
MKPLLIDRALLLSLIACLPAYAADEESTTPAWSPYVTLTAETDESESSQVAIDLGSSIGAGGWIRGGVGRLELADDDEEIGTDVFTLAGGASIKAIDVSAALVHRTGDKGFKQQDGSFALGWQGSRGAIGGDVFIRQADSETVISVQRRRLDPRELHIVESIDGRGYGIHGDFDITPALTVFASWMTYEYDIDTNRPILARLSLLNGSGVTRSEAYLDSSLSTAMTYHFTRASLTGQYMHDEALTKDDITDSLQLSLLIFRGDHWSLTPMLGASKNDLLGDTVYGGLSLGYTW